MTPGTAARQASVSITSSRSLLTHLHRVGDAISKISSSVVPFSRLQSFPASGSFQCVSFSHGGPKYWSFSFNISPSNEHPGFISFKADWLDLLAVQGTLQSLLQQHSSKISIVRRSAFFIVHCHIHPYRTTGKTIDLTRQTFVGKIMSLFF